jgi:RNA polymerase sigma-70 factor (sigma-E family)
MNVRLRGAEDAVSAEDTDVDLPIDLPALYRAHRLALTRLAVLLVDDVPTAEDVVQDAFANLYRHQHRLRHAEAALSYLRAAVLNGARSTLRRRGTARRYRYLTDPPAPPPDADLQIVEEHRAVLAAVQTLPTRQREVLVLRYWSNLTEAEIATAMGISRGAVKSQASRALDKLEELLRDS